MERSHKESFLAKPGRGEQIAAVFLPGLIDSYNSKYEIKIYLNGDTPFGKDVIKQQLEDIDQTCLDDTCPGGWNGLSWAAITFKFSSCCINYFIGSYRPCCRFIPGKKSGEHRTGRCTQI